MPRPRPPHLRHETTRHKRRVWYVRIGDGPRIRLKGDYGSDEFWMQYHAAVNGEHPVRHSKASAGSLAWLIERYRETGAWMDLSQATRRNRENHFKQVIKSAGHQPCKAITQATIIAAKDRRAHTPAQARNFLDAMRGLFKWAKQAQHVSIDPTIGVENPKRKKGPGFPVLTEADVEAFYKRWPLGTKERVWIDVLLFTGLRRGDAVVIGRQHVRDGVASLRTEKSQGRQITVTLPILPVLQRTLDAGPIGELAFICGSRGKPFTKEALHRFEHRVLFMDNLDDVTNFGPRRKANFFIFREALSRPFVKQECVEDCLHATSGLFKTWKRVGIARWRGTANLGVREGWI